MSRNEISRSDSEVDTVLPVGRLVPLGIQHVLVMYAGAVVVPLIVGHALKLSSEQISLLISCDLFACGIVSIIQSLGVTPWFGIRLPVMMGVSFASVGPLLSLAALSSGTDGARLMFGSIIAAGAIGIVIAPVMGRLLRLFPPVVTGTIITVIGLTLMRIGINWIFGNPVGPTAPTLVAPEHAKWLADISQLAGTATAAGAPIPAPPAGLALVPTVPNPAYGSGTNIAIAALIMLVILCILRFGRGFIANIAVLIGIVSGGVATTLLGMMHFDKVAKAGWFGWVRPLSFGMPVFEPVPIVAMVLIMLVVMVESVGMFLALGDMTGKRIVQADLTRGLRADGLGTLIGGLFNTFPYTSFSQNVGLVGVTGVKSRFVCVAGGAIMILLGLLPKLGALVESLPLAVLGGSGLIMFGMVAATGIRILAGVDFRHSRNNLVIVALSIGIGMIPLVAPNFKQWLPHVLYPIIESGIVLASVAAILLNAAFNGVSGDAEQLKEAASEVGLH
jgi:uric acid transporter